MTQDIDNLYGLLKQTILAIPNTIEVTVPHRLLEVEKISTRAIYPKEYDLLKSPYIAISGVTYSKATRKQYMSSEKGFTMFGLHIAKYQGLHLADSYSIYLKCLTRTSTVSLEEVLEPYLSKIFYTLFSAKENPCVFTPSVFSLTMLGYAVCSATILITGKISVPHIHITKEINIS